MDTIIQNAAGATPTRPRLRRCEVPEYLSEKFGIDIKASTLATYATVGGGPIMQYNGRIPLYNRSDLDDWANSRLSKRVLSTSEPR